jgi:tetratricopeptide (TPR) repeat protein
MGVLIEIETTMTTPTNNTPGNTQNKQASPPVPQRNVGRWVFWGLMLTVVSGVLAWKVGLPWARQIRGVAYAEEAEALMPSGDFKGAFSKLDAALRFAPKHPKVLRTGARLHKQIGSPAGLQLLEQLMASGAASMADRKAYVELSIALRRSDLAGRELEVLLKGNAKDLELIHLLALQQEIAGDYKRSAQTAEYALSLEPNNQKSQFLLGTLLIRSTEKPIHKSGERLLWGIALANGEFTNQAVDALAQSADLSDGETRLLIRYFLSRTNLQASDLIQADNLRIKLNPASTAETVNRTITLIAATNSTPEMLSQLGQWCLQHSQARAALQVIPETMAATNSSLASVRSFALAQSGQWDALVKILDNKNSVLESSVAHLLRGQRALSRDDRKTAEVEFNNALQQSDLTLDRVVLIARTAEATGYPVVAVKAYQRLFKVPGRGIWAAVESLRVLRGLDDAVLLRDVLRELNRQLPGDDSVAAERAWAELFVDNRSTDAITIAKRIRSAQPSDTNGRFLTALALLKEDKHSEALAEIESSFSRWEDLQPRWQLVYVATLGANHQREAARNLASKINRKSVRSAELDLIKNYLPTL